MIKKTSSETKARVANKEKQQTQELDALYSKIGKLEIENDFLKKSGVSGVFTERTSQYD